MIIIKGVISLGAMSASFFFLWVFFTHTQEQHWQKNLNPARFRPKPKAFSSAVVMAELADFLDLLGLCLSSGLNLEKAWLLALAHAPSGVLRSELEWVHESMRLGKPREEAFQELDQRLGVESLHLFFALLVQSVKAGSRLQTLFHEQAGSLRRSRMMMVERRAQTASLRLLFPLFVFIFPTLFLILFAPLLIRMSQGVSLF